jgi:galactose mutarotase-like enzyme
MNDLIIENNALKCIFSLKGAELTSLFHKPTNREVLWNGDATIWGRQAPVLFPIVGKLLDNEYHYKSKTYHLPQHGFARDHEFIIVSHSINHIQFLLTYSEQTLLVYPFPFKLFITYTLNNSELITQYKIENEGDDLMYYSIGAHPGFRCPILPSDTFETCYLEFSSNENLNRVLLKNGLRSDITETIELVDNKLFLNNDLFQVKDAIVVKSLQSNAIFLKSKNHLHGLQFTALGYSWYGIWSKPGPFVCLEPWMGVADKISHSKELEDKEGVLKLLPKMSDDFTFKISVF